MKLAADPPETVLNPLLSSQKEDLGALQWKSRYQTPKEEQQALVQTIGFEREVVVRAAMEEGLEEEEEEGESAPILVLYPRAKGGVERWAEEAVRRAKESGVQHVLLVVLGRSVYDSFPKE